MSKTKNLYLLIGNSGSGKTTIAEAIKRDFGLSILKSYTTRDKRNADDEDHIYIRDKEYEEIQDKVATRISNDGKYCATKSQCDESDIYVIDFDGYFELKDKYSNKKVITIYIDISPETSFNRMISRGDDIESAVNRVETDGKNNTKDRISLCDYIVNGDDVLTYLKVWNIITAEESIIK